MVAASATELHLRVSSAPSVPELAPSGMNVAEPAPGTFRAIAFISFAAVSPAVTFQPSSARITSAPCMQSASAAALPRPDAPPVMSAAAPERLR